MSPKNSNTVALEKRMDLASLFCMIGRHGPAVALAVVAMVSVLAAFIIYRTVRGKRRKAAAAAADGDSQSPGAERDASVMSPGHETSPVESTDVSEGSSDTKEADDVIQAHPKVRLRRVAADEKKPTHCSPSKIDIQVPDYKHVTSGDTEVFKADYQENENVSRDQDVSDEKNGQKEENLQCGSNNLMNSVESNLAEPVNHAGDVLASFICYGKDKKLEEENHQNHLCLEEEKNQGVDNVTTTPDQDIDGDDNDDSLVVEVTSEILDKYHKCTAAKFDTHPPPFHEQEVELQQKLGFTWNKEDDGIPVVIDHMKKKMLTSDNIAGCGEECGTSGALHNLSEPPKLDNHDQSLSGITTDAKAQISDTVNVLGCQQPQSAVKEDEINPPFDKDPDLNILHFDLLSVKKEIQGEKNETGPTVMLAEKSIDSKHKQAQDQQTGQKVSNDAFDKSSVPADEKASVAAALEADENVTASVMTEDPFLVRPSICQNQQSEHMENNEALDETRVHSTAVCDKAAITATITSKEISHPDTLSSFHDQQSDQIQNNDIFSEVTIGAAPVLTADVHSPLCKINLLSFEQSELRHSDKDSRSSPGVGEESGISSMTVSPDLQIDCNEFNITDNNMALPVMDCNPQPEERTETQSSLFADDVALSVSDDGTEGLVSGPFPSRLSQKPHSELTDCPANEDMFGHEIEDCYHSALDRFMAQIAESVMSVTSEPKMKTGIKNVVEVKESKEGVTAKKKVEAEAEKEEEEHEKTDISIMEATMDNNEWIMDSNYQVLPWMNVSVPSFAQDNIKTCQPHSEERQNSSSLPDTTCIDTNTTLSTEVKQTNHLSLVDDNMENSKKVVAVQPMPQNVNVTFRIHYLTHSPYQTVAVTGNLQELGNWKEFVPLERAKDGHWATVVSLPAENHVEWKFVVVDKGQVCRWEECGNRLLDTGYGDDLIVHKWWGFL